MNFIGIITGPTGVGKTDFVLKLADHLPIEIINADVGQFYVPLNIGTAKPNWRRERVPHHLFDILDEPRSMTVIQYRTLAHSLIQECWARNTIPFFVGGSFFYIQSLLFPPREQEESGQNQENERYAGDAWELLARVDPVRASQIHKNDTYRIERALSLWRETGKLPSTQQPIYNPIAPYLLIQCTRTRKDLYERINKRVDLMMNEGLLNETRALQGTAWVDFLMGKKIIGYDDCLRYLMEGDQDLGQLSAIIAQKTRNYAKRQETFWRGLVKKIVMHENDASIASPQISTVDLTLLDLDLYIKQLSFLMPFMQKKVDYREKL
jgi:tRNA dimethylallyltransferase